MNNLESQFINTILFDQLEEPSSLETKEKVCYLEYDDGFTLSPKCIIRTELTNGIYEAIQTREGIYFLKTKIFTDKYIDLSQSKENDIIKEILAFKDKAELFKNNDVIHKRGILLYGDPGCGKTSFINFFLKKFTEQGGIAFVINTPERFSVTVEALKQVQNINPDQQMLVIIEEIDKFANIFSELQNFLDGQNSLQHVITVATTNHVKDLPAALLRPSRFDWIISLEKLTGEAREKYLRSKGVEDKVLNKWVKDTDGFTIAMLKELFISVYLLSNDYGLSLKKIQDGEQFMITSTFKSIGFNNKKN